MNTATLTRQQRAIMDRLSADWMTLHELRERVPLQSRLSKGRRDCMMTQLLVLIRAGLVEERGGCADGGKRSHTTEWAKEPYEVRRKP